MYSKIVVPLDTSELAEQALPHAAALAERFGADLELLTVVSASSDDAIEQAGPGDEWDPRTLEAQEYLEAVAARSGIRFAPAADQHDGSRWQGP